MVMAAGSQTHLGMMLIPGPFGSWTVTKHMADSSARRGSTFSPPQISFACCRPAVAVIHDLEFGTQILIVAATNAGCCSLLGLELFQSFAVDNRTRYDTRGSQCPRLN